MCRKQRAFGVLAISQDTSCITAGVHYRSMWLTPVIHLEYLYFTLKCQYFLRYSDIINVTFPMFSSAKLLDFPPFLLQIISKMAVFNNFSAHHVILHHSCRFILVDFLNFNDKSHQKPIWHFNSFFFLFFYHHCHKRFGSHTWPAGFQAAALSIIGLMFHDFNYH